jgi:hypothetical protein
MVSRFLLILLLSGVLAIFVFAARWIVKLPQKYERSPRNLNPWSALDKGIDPSETGSEMK